MWIICLLARLLTAAETEDIEMIPVEKMTTLLRRVVCESGVSGCARDDHKESGIAGFAGDVHAETSPEGSQQHVFYMLLTRSSMIRVALSIAALSLRIQALNCKIIYVSLLPCT